MLRATRLELFLTVELLQFPCLFFVNHTLKHPIYV
jgi:hypothetical protein